MKRYWPCIVALSLGIALGWFSSGERSRRDVASAINQMLEAIESAESANAARSVRVIQLLDAGEKQAAVKLLCTPIASVYRDYSGRGLPDERKNRLRVLIDELASSNQVVAAEISNNPATVESQSK